MSGMRSKGKDGDDKESEEWGALPGVGGDSSVHEYLSMSQIACRASSSMTRTALSIAKHRSHSSGIIIKESGVVLRKGFCTTCCLAREKVRVEDS